MSLLRRLHCTISDSHKMLPHSTSGMKQTSVALYRGADKSLARLGRKQTTEIEDFEFHISYLYS